MRRQPTLTPAPTRMVALTAQAVQRFGRTGKAGYLARSGAATRLDHLSAGQRAVYLVTGDGDRYRVTLHCYRSPWQASCPCTAGRHRRLCAHALAAAMLECRHRGLIA